MTVSWQSEGILWFGIEIVLELVTYESKSVSRAAAEIYRLFLVEIKGDAYSFILFEWFIVLHG